MNFRANKYNETLSSLDSNEDQRGDIFNICSLFERIKCVNNLKKQREKRD